MSSPGPIPRDAGRRRVGGIDQKTNNGEEKKEKKGEKNQRKQFGLRRRMRENVEIEEAGCEDTESREDNISEAHVARSLTLKRVILSGKETGRLKGKRGQLVPL